MKRGEREREEGRSYWESCQRQSGDGKESEFAPRNGREVGSILTLRLFPGYLIYSEAPGTAVIGTSRSEITA